jgi:predicted ATPase
MRPELPSGTVTFLFTDVEGSTRLLHELGAEGYAEALAEHRRVIREACAAEGGVEVDTQGDAFFFAFPTAPGALAAAQAFTDGLARGLIRVRVGLHTGTPHSGEEGYVGEDVHFAARVAAAAHGGQVVISAETAALAGDGLVSLGSHRLKDIPEPVTIFQLGGGSFPPLKTIANSNLPTPASSFLGRESELFEADLLLQGTRLLTVSGPGGAGKTRFSLELARRAREERFSDYPDGVFSCFLSSLRDPALVLPTIAQTLTVAEQPGLSALEALASHLAGKRMLLLLDNLEHLLEAASELSQLVERASGLTLLVTSRELLRIRGETTYALPSLPDEEAVALFCERAQVEPSEPIGELCARLEGLPLALELAAARLRILTPEQLLDRLSQRLDLLKGGRDADPRQETLRATIESSYELLSEEEKLLFRALSVFAGGCTLEAAEEVAEADLDTLQSLVEKSLVRFTNGRYWMLETIREYAVERLEGLAESRGFRRRHALYLGARYAELSREEPAWLPFMEADRDNLRAAMSWTLEAGEARLSVTLATAYGALCAYKGPFTEGRIWLETALGKEGDVPPAARMKALLGAASLAQRHGDLDTAELCGQEALTLAKHLGEAESVGRSLRLLGIVSGDRRGFERSESLLREALAVFDQCGNDREVTETLGMLGFLEIARGDYAQARSVIEEALALSRAVNDPIGIGINVSNLGWVLARQGRFDEALPLMRESVLWVRDVSDVNAVANQLEDVAAAAAGLGDSVSASVMLGGAELLHERTDAAFEPVGRETHEDTVARLQRELDEELLSECWERGRNMSLDELVDYAVEFIDSQA